MLVETIMTKDIGCCSKRDPLCVPAQIMWDCDCGFVPIVDEHNRIVAVITDRDICMAAYTQGRPLHEIPTQVAMTRLVYFCRPWESIESAETLMKARQVRRLPVVDECERVVGVLSLGDLARHCNAASDHRRTGVRVRTAGFTTEDIAETLSSICAPHEESRPNEPALA